MKKSELVTPSYVFDTDVLKAHMMLIKDIIGNRADVCFAMKANPFIISPMDEYTSKFEVCSPGEYEICNSTHINPEKIVVSGVNKNYASMERILSLSNGKGIYTIESMMHYQVLSQLAAEKGLKLKVLIRLTSGNQFGVDENGFMEILSKIAQDKNIEFAGVHYYSGTQKKLAKVEKELEMLSDFAGKIKEAYNISSMELEYGPGLCVSYFCQDKPCDAKEQLESLALLLDGVKNYSKITIEMGRFIATTCGSFVTKVIDIKKNNDTDYLIIDGGIHQLNYYGQIMGMKCPHMEIIPEKNDTQCKYNICGSLCTVNDVIVKDAPLPLMEKGDTIVFKNTGAYSVTEGMSLFLSRELPQIYFYSDNKGYEVVRSLSGAHIINSIKEEK